MLTDYAKSAGRIFLYSLRKLLYTDSYWKLMLAAHYGFDVLGVFVSRSQLVLVVSVSQEDY